MRHFYNTIGLDKEAYIKASRGARTQEEIILAILDNSDKPASPTDVYLILERYYPITSIRRAFTNLTKSGKLVKTDQQKEGLYGKPNYTWIVKGKVYGDLG